MLSQETFQSAVGELQSKVKSAIADKQSVQIVGGSTRKVFGRSTDQSTTLPELSCCGLDGVLSYQSSELVVKVAAGTPVNVLNDVLLQQGQMLAFEPHDFNLESTIGGVIASGLSGSARPWRGAIKDYVLGMGLINGNAQHLNFGGQVMKNVAGYDVSRMMVGSLGCFGLITDVSLKVLPIASSRRFVRLECGMQEALKWLQRVEQRMHPVTGFVYFAGTANIRLEGDEAWLDQFLEEHALLENSAYEKFWQGLTTHEHPFFANAESGLWRISVPKYSDLSNVFELERLMMDWGGAQYWIRGTRDEILAKLEKIKAVSGTVYSLNSDDIYCLPEMSPYLTKLHKQLKQEYDPSCIFNPGRMSAEF